MEQLTYKTKTKGPLDLEISGKLLNSSNKMKCKADTKANFYSSEITVYK